MPADRVIEVLEACADKSITVWVCGGWGVDALAGKQTRPHRDLDLLVTDQQSTAAMEVLVGLGYERETDWWPVRAEYGRTDGGCVDLHPLTFHDDGSADQPGLDLTTIHYPVPAFAEGVIAGRLVGCLSVEQQRVFHSGYELRPHDHRDLAVLDSLLQANH